VNPTKKLGLQFREFETLMIVALGVIGFLGAPVIVTWGGAAAPIKVALSDSAGASSLLWLLLIGVQGALWVISVPVIVMMYSTLRRIQPLGVARLTYRVVIPTSVLAGALMLLFTRFEVPWWPPDRVGLFLTPMLGEIGYIGVIVATSAVAGMLYAGAKANALASNNQDLSSKISSYLEIHRMLDGYLLIASVVLGLGVMASSALRATMNVEKGCVSFPQEWIVLYGGIYSLLLGIAYSAVKIGMLRCGHTIRDALMSDPPETAADLTTWAKTEVDLRQSLRLRFEGISSLGDTFAVFAPLLVALVSGLLSQGN